jgi:hypothetical protein
MFPLLRKQKERAELRASVMREYSGISGEAVRPPALAVPRRTVALTLGAFQWTGLVAAAVLVVLTRGGPSRRRSGRGGGSHDDRRWLVPFA